MGMRSAGFSFLLLFTACAVTTTQVSHETRPILDLSDPQVLQRIETKSDRPDFTLLAKIVLPKSPSKQEVRDYINTISYVSKNQRSYLDYDPQIAMLTRVGHENIDELILATGSYDRYLVEAVKALIKTEDKKLILDSLDQHPALISVVTAKGWVKESREILVNKMRGNPNSIPPEWIAAVASLRDPTTYSELIYYFMNGANKGWTYKYIRNLPGIDLTQAAPIAWEKTRADKYENAGLMEAALTAGYQPALDFVFETLDNNNALPPSQYSARAFIFQFTGAQGSNEELKAWYEASRKHLRFDVEAKRFVVIK